GVAPVVVWVFLLVTVVLLVLYKVNLDNYEEPAVLVTCRSRLNLIRTIKEQISNTQREALLRKTCFGWFLDLDDWSENCAIIHFMLGQQVECLGVETDIVPLSYHIVDDFEIQCGRRHVFSSAKDGKPITGKMFEKMINSLEDRRKVPDWILRLANDTDGWDMYPWGSYEKVDDTKAYSVFGFTWAFKGRLPTARLTPYENKAGSDRWVSSMAYFDGRISEAARMPRHVNRQNLSDVPSEFYREFEEQKRAVDQMMKKDAEREKMYDQMRKFMHDMKVGPVQQAKKGSIIVGQHYGLSVSQSM
nr:hypothetical protein [Tanacetum cinerariifolium]